MFPANRQARLDPVLQALRQLPGQTSVQQDDFDSAGINVFIYLDDCNSRAGSFDGAKPFHFAVSLRSTKAKIRSIFEKNGIPFNFLNWPVMQYQYQSIGRERRAVKDGYDGDSIKIEVLV